MGGFAESIAVHDLCAAAPDGTMAVRTGPGLGVDVDADRIARATLRVEAMAR